MMPSPDALLADPFRLEKYLMGLDLAELVAALPPGRPGPGEDFGPAGPPRTRSPSGAPGRRPGPDEDFDEGADEPDRAREALGEYLPAVLHAGLRVVPPDVLRRFLDTPGLLLGLQALLLLEGGPYWESVGRSAPGVSDLRPPPLERLEALLRKAPKGQPQPPAAPPPAVLPLPAAASAPAQAAPHRAPSSWRWATRAAVAASLVIAVGAAVFLAGQNARLEGVVNQLREAARSTLPVVPATQAALYRQYYSPWALAPQFGYQYSVYRFQPDPGGPYQEQYVIRDPRRPRYAYYYNPQQRVFWGRYDMDGGDNARYSVLPEKDRKATLEQVPEQAFPPPGPMPPVPQAGDNAPMLPPPPSTLKEDRSPPVGLPALK
jgi:hypothetical protein